MKLLLYTLILFMPHLSALSQKKTLSYKDYYRVENGLASSQLWLNSDSTFFIMYADCTSSDISKGKWALNKDTVQLSELHSYDTSYRLKIEAIAGRGDSLGIFVRDLFGFPAKYYGITLFNQLEKPAQLHTDETGMIVVKNGRFDRFTTEYEELHCGIEQPWESCLYKIDTSATRLIVTLNYPEKLLSYRELPTIVTFKGVSQFIIKDKKTLSGYCSQLIYKRRKKGL